MAGISSKAAGELQNRYKFNDATELESNEFSDGTGLELYATEYRSYDPQIGRFHQMDPLAEFFEDWSPFVFAYNNPISFNDPLGLSADSSVAPVTPKPEVSTPENPTVLDEVVVESVRKKNPLQNIPSQSVTPQPQVVEAPGFVVKRDNVSLAGSIPIFVGIKPEIVLPPALALAGTVMLWQLAQPNTYGKSSETYVLPNTFNQRDNTNRYVPPVFMQTQDKTIDALLPGSLKRSPSYHSPYGSKTREEIEKLAKQGDQKAKKIKKLLDQIPRLLDKNKNK